MDEPLNLDDCPGAPLRDESYGRIPSFLHAVGGGQEVGPAGVRAGHDIVAVVKPIGPRGTALLLEPLFSSTFRSSRAESAFRSTTGERRVPSLGSTPILGVGFRRAWRIRRVLSPMWISSSSGSIACSISERDRCYIFWRIVAAKIPLFSERPASAEAVLGNLHSLCAPHRTATSDKDDGLEGDSIELGKKTSTESTLQATVV
ncbi:hypothetical protein KM043_005276 [Ampulex compressa]|nr:hypothetical protein KM043_005276 [Ampulex compressa]